MLYRICHCSNLDLKILLSWQLFQMLLLKQELHGIGACGVININHHAFNKYFFHQSKNYSVNAICW